MPALRLRVCGWARARVLMYANVVRRLRFEPPISHLFSYFFFLSDSFPIRLLKAEEEEEKTNLIYILPSTPKTKRMNESLPSTVNISFL